MKGGGFRRGPSLPRLLIPFIASTLPLAAVGVAAAADPNMASMPGMNMSGDVMRAADAGSYHIELHVLPPEPFYTAADIAAKHPSAGMVVVGGARPLAPDASPAPDHHLVVHVFDRATGKPVTDAKVSLSYKPADGSAAGKAVKVPVVIMQAIGSGAASTHYGNNVHMAAGAYVVTVTVNGTPATIQVGL